ncbi:hypothetical protein KC19_2G144800 [Ceratodon purpureus]|uniref:F-box domain-containing protein n=1 Tax=Ceratodon purpureus TaxID=3225 RepID=A0A8T0ITW2_CERPU|nr:hypothetical protein KC19_2G144800 [Ceratodon purpureus]
MDLSGALWSDLPLEMLEQVLSYVPVPDLCRYRIVSKRWDRLMCDPKFGSLCAQNAAKREASLIAMWYRTGRRRHEGWCFLDVNARRWYVFKYDGQGIWENFFYGNVRMDGGLVCRLFREAHKIVVYNPISQTHREVPTVPHNCFHSIYNSVYIPALIFVVDNISLSFKIFLIVENDLIRLVYDSVTNEWKTLNSPLCISSGSKLVGSRVLFEGYLYYFSYPPESKHPRLWRYNLVKGAWENLNLDVPILGVRHADLVVNAKSLFLVSWSRGAGLGLPWSFQLSELKIPDMTREVLFEMSKADVVEVFETGIENRTTRLPRISAFSFGNSILFMSESTGITAAFDLVTRSWDRNFPPNPLEYLRDDQHCVLFGEQMNLLLPCTLW